MVNKEEIMVYKIDEASKDELELQDVDVKNVWTL